MMASLVRIKHGYVGEQKMGSGRLVHTKRITLAAAWRVAKRGCTQAI